MTLWLLSWTNNITCTYKTCPLFLQTKLENTGVLLGDTFHLRLEQRPQSFLSAPSYPGSSHFPPAPSPYSSLSGVQESTSHPLSMPVLVPGTEPIWKNQFGRVEVNHHDGEYHKGAKSSGLSGGMASVGRRVIERDYSIPGRSSSFTSKQESEVRCRKK